MNYTQIPITVNTDIRRMIDPANTPYFPLSNSKRPEFVKENTFVLCLTCIDNDKAAIVFNAGDTFDGGGDIDFSHFVAEGTTGQELTAAATISSLIATVTPEADVPSSGYIRVYNASGEWEQIAFTAFNSGTNTFTVDHTLTYSYANGATCKVQDNLMFVFDDDDVDIAGDWDDIDRATGKISIRISCNDDSFSDKLADYTSGRAQINLQVRRYPDGETEPSTILLDYCYAQDTVLSNSESAGNANVTLLTQTSGDARYARLAGAVDIEITDATKGFIIKDRITGTRYRMAMVNGEPGWEIVT